MKKPMTVVLIGSKGRIGSVEMTDQPRVNQKVDHGGKRYEIVDCEWVEGAGVMDGSTAYVVPYEVHPMS